MAKLGPRRSHHPQGGTATTAAMRQARALIRNAMLDLSVMEAAKLADCSENTILRILKGENVRVRTLARILEGLGYSLQLAMCEKPPDIALTDSTVRDSL